MSLFEALVEQVRATLKDRGRPLAAPAGELPSPRASSGLILKADAASELGSPEVDSALTLLYSNADTDKADLAELIGKPLDEVSGSVPFAMAVIVSGKDLDAETFYRLTLRLPRLADHPGWMVKADKSRVWVRIAKNAAPDALEVAAATLISRIHAAFPQIERVELYFVVDDGKLVELLSPLAEESQKTLREVKTGVWKDRGFDYESCALSGHCGSCADKKTCASVRKIQARVNVVRREHRRIESQQGASSNESA